MAFEARCPHHFLRSQVKCPTCDAAEVRAEIDKRSGGKRPPKGAKTTRPAPNLKYCPVPAEHAEPAPIRSSETTKGLLPRWWRIELDETGNVKSCTAVEHRGEPGERRFFYVLAVDQKAAGRAAWNEHVKLEQRSRRLRLIREGKCPWCQRDQDRSPGKRCSTCLIKELACDQRRRARAAGVEVQTPDRVTSLANSRSERLLEYRIEILREVLREALNSSPRQLQQWLEAEISGTESGHLTAAREAM